MNTAHRAAKDRTIYGTVLEQLGRYQLKHVWTNLHRVDDEFIPTLKDEYHCFEQSPVSVKPDPKLPGRIVFVELVYPQRPICGLDCVLRRNSMFPRRLVNFHAAYAANASRIASERVLCSRAARASSAASSSAVNRNATTCET